MTRRRPLLTRTGAATVLRLEGFSTSNGPDVRVYLVAADSVPDSRTVGGAEVIDLGALKGNLGDQNYAVPTGTELLVRLPCRDQRAQRKPPPLYKFSA